MSSWTYQWMTLAVFALPVLFAISLHEAAHGYVARLCGDPTAADLGRVSLNPLRHIDPLGTLLLPLLAWWLIDLPFGYARPVPVDYHKLRQPRRDAAFVAAAGPAANLIMGVLWALLGQACAGDPLCQRMAAAGVLVNAAMFVFNMLPLPPLDGGEILLSLLPKRVASRFDTLRAPWFDPRVLLRALRGRVPRWLAIRIVTIDLYGVAMFTLVLVLLKFHVLDGVLGRAMRATGNVFQMLAGSLR